MIQNFQANNLHKGMIHSEVSNEVTVQTEARQISNSNSHHQGLFKVNVLALSDNLSSFSPGLIAKMS